MDVGTLVPASSLEALNQLLSHDSNKNKSQVVVSSHDPLQAAPSRSSSIHQSPVPWSSSSSHLPTVLSTQLTGSSMEQLRPDQQTASWSVNAKHLSMPSLVDFL